MKLYVRHTDNTPEYGTFVIQRNLSYSAGSVLFLPHNKLDDLIDLLVKFKLDNGI